MIVCLAKMLLILLQNTCLSAPASITSIHASIKTKLNKVLPLAPADTNLMKNYQRWSCCYNLTKSLLKLLTKHLLKLLQWRAKPRGDSHASWMQGQALSLWCRPWMDLPWPAGHSSMQLCIWTTMWCLFTRSIESGSTVSRHSGDIVGLTNSATTWLQRSHTQVIIQWPVHT